VYIFTYTSFTFCSTVPSSYRFVFVDPALPAVTLVKTRLSKVIWQQATLLLDSQSKLWHEWLASQERCIADRQQSGSEAVMITTLSTAQ